MPLDLAELQGSFREALFTGSIDAVDGALIGRAESLAPRFAIYRNNVFGSLVQALAAAYPVTCRVLGMPFFRGVARAYARAFPPERPELSAYGAGFAEHLAGLSPLAAIPQLVELARLEWLMIEAYFAADAPALVLDDLRAVPPALYPGLRLLLHPSVRLLASPFAAGSFWRIAREAEGAVEPIDLRRPQCVIVLRPYAEVVQTTISQGDHALLGAIEAGADLTEAARAATGAEPNHDLQAGLGRFLALGVFSGFDI